MAGDSTALGLALIVLAGIMAGSFTSALKALPHWAWENTWILYSLWGMVILPWILAAASVENLSEVLTGAHPAAYAATILFGASWGMGSVTFGLGTAMVGNSLGFAIILGMTAALGSVIPLLVLTPDEAGKAPGIADFAALGVAFGGLACLAWAGTLRERDSTGGGGSAAGSRLLPDGHPYEVVFDEELGGSADDSDPAGAKAGPGGAPAPSSFLLGLGVCVVSGVLSPMLNLALTFGSEFKTRAARTGHASPAMANNAVWALAVTAGSASNLVYCSYLLATRGTWRLFLRSDGPVDGQTGCCPACSCLQVRPGSPLQWLWPVAMAALWFGGTVLYGVGASMMGPLGEELGWPIFITLMVLTGNVSGYMGGEWTGAPRAAVTWLVVGLLVLTAAAAIIGVGASL